ncbi:aminoglycoside phosphotransferase family protein [Ruegeria sp. 6PALISEP08]|uniref:aminoglycoside phosphotransferase family protein n=1 Tax=Ruegeria sp. 6PALISEP08 TaxID=1225660 RepID=UPI00067E7626|nr:aminoglycoside phosphotransferase family protein [Ruegeria sp. 6PALISEP08]
MQAAPAEILERWGLTPISQVSETAHAWVWKVRAQAGVDRALKVYRRIDRGNEAPGAHLMAAWQGRGAVRIVNETASAVLMEWLEGPSLGDIARNGNPDRAVKLLARAAQGLHKPPQISVQGLKPLERVFAPLFTVQYTTNCSRSLRRDIEKATTLAQALLDEQPHHTALHGDFHPDNIIVTPDGPKIIDAKGYFGDPAFELANALRHPKGMPDLVRQPTQIEYCLSLYARAMNVPRLRLAQWAAAKCALSIYWRSRGPITQDAEADLLQFLLRHADQ